MIGAGLGEALAMVWDTLWALVLGFLLSGAVQAFVPRREMRRLLGDHGLWSVLRATGFGAASSSCSYAATAMSKSLFTKGADFVAAMVFMFASTNLVVELGIVLAVLVGWQFTASELLGGLVMIGLFVLVARVTIPERLVRQARDRLTRDFPDQAAAGGGGMGAGAQASAEPGFTTLVRSRQAWRDAAGYAVADLTMLRKEMAIGFLVAGFLAALVPVAVWQVVFIPGHGFWSSLENVVVAPFIALLSFVCSVGNVPLAAALWKGGISFGGVVSFIFADLISLPILFIYSRYYGRRLTLRLLGSFWLVMSAAGLIVQYVFSWLRLVPTSRPQQIVPNAFSLNYTSGLDAVALLVLAWMLWESHRRPVGERYARDPVCGMQVDVATAPAAFSWQGLTHHFCSDRCRARFAAEPERFLGPGTVRASDLPHDVVDPVCGMMVDPAHPGATVSTPGGVRYFCGPSCAARFQGQAQCEVGATEPTTSSPS